MFWATPSNRRPECSLRRTNRRKECGNEEYTLKGSEKIDYLVKSQNTDGTGEITIKAVMAPKDNKLTYGKKGKGTISVDPSVSSGAAVLADTKLTFTATPDKAAGWHFEEWRWSNDGGSNAVSDGMTSEDGTDCRNYGVLDGIPEAKKLMADMIGVKPENVIVSSTEIRDAMAEPLSRVIDEVVNNKAMREQIIAAQRERLKDFAYDTVKAQLQDFLRKYFIGHEGASHDMHVSGIQSSLFWSFCLHRRGIAHMEDKFS